MPSPPPKGPCTQIVYTLAPKYVYYSDYVKANVYPVYTIWVHAPLGLDPAAPLPYNYTLYALMAPAKLKPQATNPESLRPYKPHIQPKPQTLNPKPKPQTPNPSIPTPRSRNPKTPKLGPNPSADQPSTRNRSSAHCISKSLICTSQGTGGCKTMSKWCSRSLGFAGFGH